MSSNINIKEQTVLKLFSNGQKSPFAIPDFQRPYSWSSEEINTLFNDLWEFANSDEGGFNKNGVYFLGCIVSYTNEKGEQEIIDGQQRITSLYLLLRVIYTKLENGIESDERTHFMNMIKPLLWKIDPKNGNIIKDKLLLTSRVIDDKDNDTFKNIINNGVAEEKAMDRYSQNYNYFLKCYDDYSSKSPKLVYQFIHALLNQAILLPIAADSEESALRIFSTLNDRGLLLSDADIFKAKIYNHLDKPKDKESFINAWRNLERDVSEVGEQGVQALFYYYMFYLRAKAKDKDTTVSGMRKFYAENSFKRLYDKNLLVNLDKILNIWRVVNLNISIDGENWSKDIDIKKALDILSSYPNVFWKYPVVVFYLSHKDDKSFTRYFKVFLNKLIATLLSQYLVMPNVSSVKGDILKLNLKIIDSPKPVFDFKPLDSDLKKEIAMPNRNLVRMILKILAYNENEQKELLAKKWEIEHIYPKTWEPKYTPKDISKSELKIKIECIGNKLPLLKSLNTSASNHYFEEKRKVYKKSDFAIVNKLANRKIWGHEQIDARKNDIVKIIKSFIEKWHKRS